MPTITYSHKGNQLKPLKNKSALRERDMGNPHAVVIPIPAQGHVIPLMELSYRLIDHGFKVTFINTEFNHKRILDSLSIHHDHNNNEFPIRMISIPDGLDPEDDRNDFGKLSMAAKQVMPQKLAEAIRKINSNDEDDTVTCLIADKNMGWALEVAEKMGIRRAAFYPASAALLAQGLIVPKLIQDGIIDDEGVPTKNQIIQLSPNMPTMNTEKLPWNLRDSKSNKIMFKSAYRNTQVVQAVDWIICNSALELEPAAFTLFPKIIPIGPLLASSRPGRSSGHFWPEDLTCLNWLNQQPARSVIYVAFGSFTIFEQIQFQELALGLELSGKRFLWVIRPDSSNTIPYPHGFQARVSTRGKIVGWAPQQSVLSHPSIACFFSHCGWNSTMEGVSNGVPFLCWPYFGDQFLNQDYICDIWEIGLRLSKDENGIIPMKEICEKLNQVYNNEELRARALELKEITRKALEDGESSSKNLEDFVKGMI